MDITVVKEVYEVDKKLWQQFGLEPYRFTGAKSSTTVSLKEYTSEEVQALKTKLAKAESAAKAFHVKRKLAKVLRDIAAWQLACSDGAGEVRARTTRQAEELLAEYVQQEAPQKHLFQAKSVNGEDRIYSYYLNRIEYRRPDREGDGEGLCLDLHWLEFGQLHKKSCFINCWDCVGRTPTQILATHGYVIETEALQQQQAAYEARFLQVYNQVGKQFLATGSFSDRDVPDNDYRKRDEWWYGAFYSQPVSGKRRVSKVVVDVFRESAETNDTGWQSRDRPRMAYWLGRTNKTLTGARKKNRLKELEMESHDYDDEEDSEGQVTEREATAQLKIPLHPNVVVFDLVRHARLKTHVADLTEYQYNKQLLNSLVLPPHQLQLIGMLLGKTDEQFHDLVIGKGGGILVLAQGPAGVGKTLTAEIYAEYQERPLYSVQCSQLGVDPAELESNLLKILARGRRWDAVVLLDEADVYIGERRNDLQQNAIVGVFLRVLEYNEGTLFMTTNRSDLVDDAISSRCTATIQYVKPTPEMQQQIWQKLVKANNIVMPKAVVEQVSRENPDLTGRDVKQLLKLANMLAKDRKTLISAAIIREVREFRPGIGPSLPSTGS